MSEDADEFVYRPAAPGGLRRRVSMRVAVPVVAGCAALGTIAGVIAPLRAPGVPVAATAPQPVAKTLSAVDKGPGAAAAAVPGEATATAQQAVSPRTRQAPLQSARTVSEDEHSAAARSPALATGSLDQRSSRAADDAGAAGANPKQEASREETSAGSPERARRLRAKRVRRVYPPQSSQSSKAPAVAPFSQSTYNTTLAPPQ